MKTTNIFLLIAFFFIGIPFLAFSQSSQLQTGVEGVSVKLKGLIIEQETHIPLPYVNIGVLNKPIGTVSDTSGHFDLLISKENFGDTIQISLIGYRTKKLSVEEFIKVNGGSIELHKQNFLLNEVVVVSSRMRSEIVGRQKDGGYVKFSLQPKKEIVLGSEIGVKIKLKDTPAVLKDFGWYLGANNFKNIKFRINIYSLKNNYPDSLILDKEVYAEVLNSKTGWNKIDLESFNLIVNSDFAITLQWIEHEINKDKHPEVHIPGILTPFHVSYFRVASQDKWKKVNANLNYHVTLLYE